MEHAQLPGQNSIVRSAAQVEAPVHSAATRSDPAANLPVPQAPVESGPPSEEKSPYSEGLLKSVWQARGFFGGMLAIQIAYYGQRALMERNDYPLSTFCYGLAIVILILSLLHPSLPRRRSSTPPVENSAVDLSEAAPMAHIAAENGHSPDGTSPSAPSDATESRAIPVALPVRRAGSQSRSIRVAESTITPAEAQGNDATPATPSFESWEPGTPAAPVATRKARPNNGSSPRTATPVTTAPASAMAGRVRISEVVSRIAAWRARAGWRVTLPALAVSVGLLVWSFFALRSNIVEPLGGWLWAGGLVGLLVALTGVPGWPRGKSLLPGPRDDFFGRGVPGLDSRWSILLVALVLAAAIALRLYNLEYHPGIFGDEGERGIDARNILQGNNALIFGVGWWGVPNLYFYLTSFFLGLLGDHNMVADRMLSVVSGVVAVWYLYRTGRLLWGPRVGLIAAALLAVSPLALQFSRLAGESTPTGTLWAVGFYYMVLALRDRKWTDWLLSGLAWGFSLYFYAAGKLIIPLAAALGFYCLVRWRLDFFKRYALGIALLGATMLLTAMPYVIYAAESNFLAITSRAQETSIFTPSNQAVTFQRYNLPYDPALAEGSTLQSLAQHPVEWARLIYEQARETLDVLYRRADQVFFYLISDHGGSMFPAFWATIVMLGIAYATWKLWDSRFGLVLIWFWFGLLGSILTVDTPNLQRVTGAWPALMLFPAALLDRVFAAGWPLSLSMARRWATLPIAAAVLFFGYTSVQEYFGHYASTCPYCDSTMQARYAVDLGQDYKAYQLGVGGYPMYFGYGSTRFLAKDVEGVDVLAAADHLPAVDSKGKGLAFIVYANNFDYLPLIKLYYPGGTEEAILSADGVQRFMSYKVTREQLAKFQVATATYRPATGDPVTREEPGLGTQRAQLVVATQGRGQQSMRPQAMEPWTPPAGATYPLQATWEGGLVAPHYGGYTFVTNGTATGVRLLVDGIEVVGGDGAEPGEPVELVLAKGVHEIILSGNLADANTSLGLLWSGAGGEARPVETRFLYKGPMGGLTAEVGHLDMPEAQALKVPGPFSGQEVRQRRVDPFIGFRETYDLFGSSPYLARWYGTIKADTDGLYGFYVSSPQHTVLMIDDSIVIDGGNGLPSGSAQLSAGPHKIEMRYVSPGGGARVELFWNTPGGQGGIVPPTALVPARRSWFNSELVNAPAAQLQPPPEASPPPTIMRAPRAILGAEAGLREPRGLAVDGAGNVYVGDNGNRRVVVFAPDGKAVSTWGAPLPETYKPEQGEAPDGAFGEISDLAVGVGADGKTYVYVLDSTTRIQVFTTDGQQAGTYPAQQLGMYGPNGLAIGPVAGEDGHRLYVSVTGQNRLAAFPSIDKLQSMQPRPLLGEVVRNIGVQGGAALEQPVDLLAEPTLPDVVYTIDLRDRLLRLKLQPSESAPGNPQLLPSIASKQWQLIVGRDAGGSRLAISPDGRRVYMSDPEGNRVAVVDVESGAVSYFGAIGRGEGEFLAPSGVAVGPDGVVYVLERLNNRVQVFEADK